MPTRRKNNQPNPDCLQRDDIKSLVATARSLIAKDPESLTDSPSPVADVVANVVSEAHSEAADLCRLKEILLSLMEASPARDEAVAIVKRLGESVQSWVVGEVVEGVLADPVCRLALNQVGLHVTVSPHERRVRA
jgi:hypothetical protein